MARALFAVGLQGRRRDSRAAARGGVRAAAPAADCKRFSKSPLKAGWVGCGRATSVEPQPQPPWQDRRVWSRNPSRLGKTGECGAVTSAALARPASVEP